MCFNPSSNIFKGASNLCSKINSSGILLFKELVEKKERKPDVIFVDLNIIGSSFDGIELCRRINYVHGDGVVIGIISSSDDEEEQAKAVKAGAQFWIIKSDAIEPRLEEFKKDLENYKNRTGSFKVYK